MSYFETYETLWGMQKVKKAIIPAAGLGTRFLPATKTVPKEMLTIFDAPIIFYVVEEAVRSGIEDVIIVAGRGKTAIEDFFDVSYELEDKLAKDGKTQLLQRLISIRDMANIISVRQKQPLGLGHAVLTGKVVVGNEPFAVLLGDEITVSQNHEELSTRQLTKAYEETALSSVSIMPVRDEDVSKYGIVDVEAGPAGAFKVKGVIEKPSVDQAPSRWALPGRYVFDAKIFDYLTNAKPGKLGEIQLSDAMDKLAKEQGMLALPSKAQRFDAGDKLGFLQANIEIAMQNPEIGEQVKALVLQTAEKIKKSGFAK